MDFQRLARGYASIGDAYGFAKLIRERERELGSLPLTPPHTLQRLRLLNTIEDLRGQLGACVMDSLKHFEGALADGVGLGDRLDMLEREFRVLLEQQITS